MLPAAQQLLVTRAYEALKMGRAHAEKRYKSHTLGSRLNMGKTNVKWQSELYIDCMLK